MKKLEPLIIITLLLTGCAQQQNYWVRPGASNEDFEMDKGQCTAQAFSIPNATLMQIAIVQNQCLRGKGWNLQRGL